MARRFRQRRSLCPGSLESLVDLGSCPGVIHQICWNGPKKDRTWQRRTGHVFWHYGAKDKSYYTSWHLGHKWCANALIAVTELRPWHAFQRICAADDDVLRCPCRAASTLSYSFVQHDIYKSAAVVACSSVVALPAF